jgi:hypothetical protein
MMSAFHPKATEQRTRFYVGFVPAADSCTAANSLITEEHGGRDAHSNKIATTIRSMPIPIALDRQQFGDRHVVRRRSAPPNKRH